MFLVWILALMFLGGSWRLLTATSWLDIASGGIILGIVVTSQLIASHKPEADIHNHYHLNNDG